MKILDVTAGPRGIWFNKHDPLATYCDIRPEVKPDRVCDVRSLPFGDKSYDLVVFDPPHCNFSEKAEMAKTYGHHTIQDIRLIITKGSSEIARVLKDTGFLLFKWNDHDGDSLSKILTALSDFRPLFGQRVAVRTKHASSTYWVCLVKRSVA